MIVQRKWLRAHIRECLIYGVLNRVGQSLMDDACVKEEECSPTSWLRNVIEYIENKDLPFHIIFVEVSDDNNNTSIGSVTNFTDCPALEIKVKIYRLPFLYKMAMDFDSHLIGTQLSLRLIIALIRWDL